MLFAIVKCIRSRRWRDFLWVPFILVGIGNVSVTWLPGTPQDDWFGASPIFFQLFGVGIQKAPIWEPWVLTVSFPLAAVCYIVWSRIRSNPSSPATPEPPPAESPPS